MDGTVTPLGGGSYLTSLSCDGVTSYGPVSPTPGHPEPRWERLSALEAQTSCETRSQSVSFLDAHSLEVIGALHHPRTSTACGQPHRLRGQPRYWVDKHRKVRRGLLGERRDLRVTHRNTFKAGQAPQKNVTMGTTCLPTDQQQRGSSRRYGRVHRQRLRRHSTHYERPCGRTGRSAATDEALDCGFTAILALTAVTWSSR